MVTGRLSSVDVKNFTVISIDFRMARFGRLL
jgi:hypothetical protein